MSLPRSLLLAALVALPLAAHAQTPTDPQQQLLTLVSRFTTAQAANDLPTLRALTADDYLEVSATGDVTSRDKLFSPAQEPALGITISLSDPTVRLFGPTTSPDTAIVIEKLAFHLPAPNNATRTIDMRGTFVARKFPTGWKLISTQVTNLHPALSAPVPN